MNREILFRGKRLDNGEWVYGGIRIVQGRYYIIPEDSNPFGFEVDPATVGQYTGLTDKNGNKIFEGDIIKCNNMVEEFVGLVDWDTCNPSMCIRYKSIRGFNRVEYDFIKCGNMTIVILGNVHDNPDTQNC